MADERKPAGLRFREPLLARIDELAAADGRSRNNWMERFLESALMETRTLEAVSSPGSGASAQSSPPSGAAPPVASTDPPHPAYVCKDHPNSPVRWNDRIGAGAMVCSVCNRRAVPR